MTNWIDSLTEAVSGSLTGSLGEQPLFEGTPTLRPWGDEGWGFATTSKPLGATDPKFTGTSQRFEFIAGNDSADNIARSRGVDPHASRSFSSIAKSQIGAPYVWADNNPVGNEGGPGSGFDCSGYTQWVYSRAFGVALPHSAKDQAATIGQHVEKKGLQPGDLIFYVYGRLGPDVDHVAIYAGNGKQYAASSSADAVTLQSVDWDHFVYGGRRQGATPTVNLKKGAGKGKGAVATSQEMTVPFPTSFGEAIGGLFTEPQPEVAAGAVGGDPAVTLSVKSTTADIQSVAHDMVIKRGWNERDWQALVQLWDRESGWRPDALNSSSGTLGIPQLNPSAHDIPQGFRTDPMVQITWGLNYIADRYGSPTAALRYSDEHHSY